MALMSSELEEKCTEAPDSVTRVIVLLADDNSSGISEQSDIRSNLELLRLTQIPEMPRFYAGAITGAQILRLADNPAIASIEEDVEHMALT